MKATTGAQAPQQAADAVAAHQPLAGVVVVDLSHIYNGPYATFLMAMAGAEPQGGTWA